MSAIATAQHPRRLTPTRVIIAAIIATIGLLLTAFSVFAGLNAVASNSSPQGVTSGTLSLTMASNGAGFTSNVSNLAPGDVVNRYVALTSGGSLAGNGLSLYVVDSTPTKLTTDSTNGLQLTVKSCSVAWNPTAGTCGGTATTLASAALANIGSLANATSLVNGAIASGTTYNLQVSLQLPNQNETTINGTVPANTIQNLSASLTWNFSEAQRTATTTNS
jgi:spore coat-associated protein N